MSTNMNNALIIKALKNGTNSVWNEKIFSSHLLYLRSNGILSDISNVPFFRFRYGRKMSEMNGCVFLNQKKSDIFMSVFMHIAVHFLD